MKAFKYICAVLISALAIAGFNFSIGITSITYYCFIGLMILCGILVLFDGFEDKKHAKNK